MAQTFEVICDVHLSKMNVGPFIFDDVFLTMTNHYVTKCTVANCTRCYTPTQGYFDHVNGRIVNRRSTLTCPSNHGFKAFILSPEGDITLRCCHSSCTARNEEQDTSTYAYYAVPWFSPDDSSDSEHLSFLFSQAIKSKLLLELE